MGGLMTQQDFQLGLISSSLRLPLVNPYWLRITLTPGSNFYPIPELTRRHPIGYYSALPSHTLTPHSGTSMSLRSTLTHCPLIGRLNHGVVFLPVIYRFFVIRASYPTARSPSLFFLTVQSVSRITCRPACLLRG